MVFKQEGVVKLMKQWIFRTYSLCSEISLNNMAPEFGINQKYKWGDPLVINGSSFKSQINNTTDKWIYIYHYGSIVFINMATPEIEVMLNRLKEIDISLKSSNETFEDEYRLEVDEKYEYVLYNDLMTSNKFRPYYIDTISLVLSKSISLERIEAGTDRLLDSVEKIINLLDKGKFNISEKEITRTSAKVLRFKYNTISYLMLLDKPKSAWINQDIENFFIELTVLFDLENRYKIITHKTSILQDITDVFSSLTHERKSTKLELMVIILILFELLISIIEFALKF